MRFYKVMGLIVVGLIVSGLGAVPTARSATHIQLVPTSTRPAPMTLTPTPAPTVSQLDNGAYIEARITPAATVWTVVQWQDEAGGWHVVEGWQGMTDEQGVVRWWVAPAQFGQQSFRWLIYDRPGGALLEMSRSFTLPRFSREWLTVEVVAQP